MGLFLRNPCLPCSRVVAVKRRPRDPLLWDTNCPMAQPQPLRPATALVRGHTFPGLLLDSDWALRGPARWQTPPARTLAQGPAIGLANLSANRLRPEIVRTQALSCPLLHGAAVVRSEGPPQLSPLPSWFSWPSLRTPPAHLLPPWHLLLGRPELTPVVPKWS